MLPGLKTPHTLGALIPYGRQDISEEDVRAVVAVLRSSHLTQGPAIERFEGAVAEVCGASHAVAVSSGSAALHLACLALDLGPGDWLWTVPNTFVASATCALHCGASVDFVDTHPETRDLDPAALEVKLRQAEALGRLPKVVVPVHMGGRPCPLDPVHELAERYGFRVLEDACHAIGAREGDRPVGSCSRSSAAVFSFHPVKLITTGEGGVITTGDAEIARRLRRLRSLGITRDASEMHAQPEGDWVYELIELGFNYRMTDIGAALGSSQLERLDGFVARRNRLAERYRDLLVDLPLGLPPWPERGLSAFHLFVVRVDAELRRELFEVTRAAGIGVNVHYIPVHLQPLFRERGFQEGDFPVAEAFSREALTLPLYPGLGEEDQDRVVQILREFFSRHADQRR